MTEPMTMRRAVASDAARVMEILEDGKRSIARFGIEQWQHGYPNLGSVERDIEQGSCYVAQTESGEILGTLALCPGVDAEYSRADVPWLTENPSAGEVPYASIHRCATAAEALKRGVMGFMFDEAARIAAGMGKLSVRVDTHPGNVAMRSFLPKRGFRELGPFDLVTKTSGEEDLTRIAYEKLLGEGARG